MMDEDGGDGSMVCTDHPFKNSSPGGGICAFCLQEKLGKLVSSSFPIAVFPASSSSESPSFRSASDQTTTTTISLSNPTLPHHHSNTNNNVSSSTNNRSKILYLLSSSSSSSSHQKNKKKNMDNGNLVFKRSKSTAAPRKPRFLDATASSKRGFWSFMYKAKQSQSTVTSSTSTSFQRSQQQETMKEDVIVVEENESPSYDRRKVSRSRSVGCGSRSFSGDFFERISTGFGDCTLRRVESQREGKPKVSSVVGGDCIKERVRCGGLFSGFMITSSSSSNSSSSSYWVASNPNNIKTAIGGGRNSSSSAAF
ncbi:hypothetical protein OSB04_029662 [Centaurea solstitialis]|uniref:Uncharacterized protein n=1 Tax=Centaurea solstitialis TaxID=347529 RepID=A0AA38W472_9ASTR|nr:hypothetical protein OSB04_029662 [Centaurea solstitialis]